MSIGLVLALLIPLAASAQAADSQAADADLRRAEEVVAGRAHSLHDRLHITPAQQPQWDAFAAVMMDNARHVAALHAQVAQAAPSAPDDLRQYARETQAHAEDVQRLIGPFEQLYGTMSPEQKVIADRTFHEFAQREDRRRASN